jgi:hypothetical protein
MQTASLEDVGLEEWQQICAEEGPVDDGQDEDPKAASSILLQQAHEAQEAVRARVDRDTWLAYRMIAIDDQPVHEVARSLGKKYAAVYNGYKRVDLMLRQEGKRRLFAIMCPAPRGSETDRPGPGS